MLIYSLSIFLALCATAAHAREFRPQLGENDCGDIFLTKAAEQLGVTSFGISKHAYISSRIAKLSVFDEATWLDLFDHYIKNGDANGTLDYDILPLLVSMPLALRNKIDAKMREVYESASKDPISSGGDRILLSPKRALVTYLHHTSDAAEHFAAMKSRGLSPIAALDSYMNEIRSRLPACAKCQYNAAQVFEVARIIQSAANRAVAAGGDPNFEFIMFGSLPNGRANIETSDLDLFAGTDDQKIMMGRWHQDIRSAVEKIIPGSKLSIGYPTGYITPQQASPRSPVQIRITASQIVIQVYPQAGMMEWGFRSSNISSRILEPSSYTQ